MDDFAELVGESPALERVRDNLRRLLARQRAGQRLPAILLQGDTGTGKGLVARLLHRHGPRRHAAFVDVNCAAIPDTLLEAELFGFERGAFTDARRAKPGLFQAAHGGVLFLDEIALLPDSVQAKLLTAVEERAVRRLGSTRPEPAEAWLISATNADLKAAVAARRFREDLYHRLAVLTLELPPLRQRRRDVLLLAERFLDRACAEYGLPAKRLDPGAAARLLAYSWPGNVRELGNVMERAALFADTPIIRADDLGPLVDGNGHAPAPSEPQAASAGPITSRNEALSRRLLDALEETDWNISLAAARLGVTRATVYARLERFGLRTPGSELGAGLRRPAGPAASAPPAAQTRLQWEQRSLTLLRATLHDSDGVLDVSRAARALDGLIAKVQSFGGYVEELTPTGLVAAFGLDSAEDAPRRAARAAIAVHKAAARAREEGEAAPGITIGLHVASLLIGRLGPRIEIDGTAKRAQWPVLDRLVQGRAAGETVASVDAAPFLDRRFELTRVNGVDAPHVVYRLTGQERRGLGLWGTMTRFVGRREEFELLKRRLAVAAEGRGQVVAVVGDAGVGKSRLIYELAPAHDLPGWRVLEGAAASYGQTMSYLPVIGLLRSYFGIEDRDDPPAVRRRIGDALLALDRALAPALPALLALLDAPVDDPAWQALDPPQRRARTLDAVRRLLLREARQSPLLVVFEDLHWIDSETQALLDGLVEAIGAARLLLLVSYRPEYVHAWGSRSYYTQLHLDLLPPPRAQELLDSLVGEDPDLAPLKELLVERGNPFFLEETIRTLVETSVLDGPRGGYRLTRPIPRQLQIPPTVQALLAARIDRLPGEDKHLLQTASVIGKDVRGAILTAIVDLRGDALRGALRRLQDAELLYEIASSPDAEYTFKHALTHEVAYASLLPDRRRSLHGRIAQTIERLYAGRLVEHVERLAYHAVRAEEWDKALTYLRQAGAKALACSANREAAAYFEQALTSLAHLPETREMRERAIDIRMLELRNSLFPLAEFGRIEQCLREGEVLAHALDDQRRLGWVSAHMCSHELLTGGHTAAARALAERVAAIGTALGDESLRVIGQYYLIMTAYLAGDFRGAERGWRQLSAWLPTESDRSRQRFGIATFPVVTGRTWAARALAERGAFDEAEALGREAVGIAGTLDHPFSSVWAFLGLAYVHSVRGDLRQTKGLLERALAHCHEHHITTWSPIVMASTGHVYALSGRVEDGVAWLERALAAYEALKMVHLHSIALAQLAESYLSAGRVDSARARADQAVALTRERGERGYEAWTLRAAGDAAAHGEAHDPAAEAHFAASLALASELEMRPLAAHCHLGLGKLHRDSGRRARAREHIALAAAMYREMAMPFWLVLAEAVMNALA